MKQFYLIVLSVLTAISSFAGTTKTLLQSTSDIMNPGVWAGGQYPAAGDTINIPTGKVLTLAASFSFPFSTHLRVWGELRMTGSPISINLDNASTIIIYGGGKLSGTSTTQKVFLNGVQIFSGTQPVIGSQWASAATGGFVPYGVSAAPLPVKFVGFSVSRTGSDVLAQWSTSEETGAEMFHLERSFDGGSTWSVIAYVAAAGNSSSLNNYSFKDKNVAVRSVSYRIRQMDKDGRFSFSTIRSISADRAVADVKIAGIQGKVLLQFPEAVKGAVTVRFVSASGQVSAQQTINQPMGQVVLNSNLKGNYIISVSNGQDVNIARQVIL